MSAALAGVVLVAAVVGAAPARFWGAHGHEISGRAAAMRVPAAMPSFFRRAVDQLAYLNPEPDRWRTQGTSEMGEAFRYDHYIDMEVVPDSALAARDRFAYLSMMQRAGMARPSRDAGLLHFRMIELYERLVVEMRLWRSANSAGRSKERAFIEQRIVNDAGVLGHYVTDGANPHHTTVHHNGWADGFPNPKGYTTERTFHARFESDFVGARITLTDVVSRLNGDAKLLGTDMRGEIDAYLRRSYGQLERLYDLEKTQRFEMSNTSVAHRQFAAERLAAGADMLRAMWWTAWVRSGQPE
jgi:hypothetical protein